MSLIREVSSEKTRLGLGKCSESWHPVGFFRMELAQECSSLKSWWWLTMSAATAKKLPVLLQHLLLGKGQEGGWDEGKLLCALVRGCTNVLPAGLSWTGLLQEAGRRSPRLQGGPSFEEELGVSEGSYNRSFVHSFRSCRGLMYLL